MPHVLYNHITHTWDHPVADDGYQEAAEAEEAPHFSAAASRLVARLALGVASAMVTMIVWGLVSGLVLEIP